MQRIELKKDKSIMALRKKYNYFKQGQFDKAKELLEEELKIDQGNTELSSALNCALFWQERKEKMRGMDCYAMSNYLMNQWEEFLNFINKIGRVSEKCLYSIKHYVYNTALANYSGLYEASGIIGTEILFQMGKLYKGIGNYEKAVQTFELSNQQKHNDPKILAELADCYAQIDEIRASKLFFREAFFIDPLIIDIENLEAVFIQKLIQRIVKLGICATDIKQWIPVYGTIWGVFNVKRELKPLEIAKLKQSINNLEKKIQDKHKDIDKIIPYLLNKYFWLIDHLINTGAPKSVVDELFIKIKKIDEKIYRECAN